MFKKKLLWIPVASFLFIFFVVHLLAEKDVGEGKEIKIDPNISQYLKNMQSVYNEIAKQCTLAL